MKKYSIFLLMLLVLCSIMLLPVGAASPYTVAVSDAANGTAEVRSGSDVTVYVSVLGESFAGIEAAVVYNPDVFTYKSGAEGMTVDEAAGEIHIVRLMNPPEPAGSVIAELVFTAKTVTTNTTASFAVTDATVGDYEDFRASNAISAAVSGDTVTVRPPVKITLPTNLVYGPKNPKADHSYTFFAQKNGEYVYYDFTASVGGKSVPLQDNGNGSWTVLNVTDDLVVTAHPKAYTITFTADSGITCPPDDTVYYGENYSFRMPSLENYTIFVSVSLHGNSCAYQISGTEITIPGSAIKGNITVHFSKTADNACAGGEHVFGEASYTWSSDNSTCTARRECACGEKKESETVMSSSVTDSSGRTTYTAKFRNEAFLTQTKTTEPKPDGKKIKVTFSLSGDTVHGEGKHTAYITWIPLTAYEISEGTTVCDLLLMALAEHGMSQRGAQGGYVSAISAPSSHGGYWLSEYDNGPKSGWMYSVNGAYPQLGLTEYILKDRDSISFHYTDDYTNADPSVPDDEPGLDGGGQPDDENEGQGGTSSGSGGSDDQENADSGEGSGEEYAPDKDTPGKEDTDKPDDTTTSDQEESTAAGTDSSDQETKDDFFEDVAESDWFYQEVKFVSELGLFEGTSDSEFSPYVTMSRAMLVTVLYRLEREPAAEKKPTFTDVLHNTWYTDAVAWAAEQGIVKGYSTDSFGPDDPVTREQMAAILYRYAGYKGYNVSKSNSLTGYSDFREISAYALRSLKWANAHGLIIGRTVDTLVPGGNATRAEVAVILYRFIQNIVHL